MRQRRSAVREAGGKICNKRHDAPLFFIFLDLHYCLARLFKASRSFLMQGKLLCFHRCFCVFIDAVHCLRRLFMQRAAFLMHSKVALHFFVFFVFLDAVHCFARLAEKQA